MSKSFALEIPRNALHELKLTNIGIYSPLVSAIGDKIVLETFDANVFDEWLRDCKLNGIKFKIIAINN